MARGDKIVKMLLPGDRIVGATYGDERNATNVTSSVLAKSINGSIDLVVDSSLVPAFAPSADLTQRERDVIRQRAVMECGGGNDTKCVKTRTDEFTQARLAEKAELAQQDPINGERLTLNVVNSRGQQRTESVAPGVNLLTGLAAEREMSKQAAGKKMENAWNAVAPSIWEAIAIGVGWFLHVVAIILSWMSLTRRGYNISRWVALIPAIFIPYSGFLILIVVFAGERLGKKVFSAGKAAPAAAAAAPAVPALPAGLPTDLSAVTKGLSIPTDLSAITKGFSMPALPARLPKNLSKLSSFLPK